MSGIVGILERDGAPVDRALLRTLAQYLSYRGPDACEVWGPGSVGFGNALLRTTFESERERQPACLDGRLWITADARIDRRDELALKLSAAGQNADRNAPASELILRSYAAWGEECVQRLYGDFSFSIWDERNKKLFCARDHFGIKPFYYADLPASFLFSNTLNCLRLHPGVSDELNDAAIGDFLLFGLNCDLATTTFRDIRRLPPAHVLTVSAEGLRLRRYWTPPISGHIRYSHASEYVENFRELLKVAVADRLRTHRVGILLSGGLDSSSLAAMARELLPALGDKFDLRAYTVVHQSLDPGPEGALAHATADFLRIPFELIAMDHLRPFSRWDDPECSLPEPVEDPFPAGLYDQFRPIGRDRRVVLEGEGSDNLMTFEMLPYARDLLRRREWRRFFVDVSNYIRVRPILPGIRRRFTGLFNPHATKPVFPRWLQPDFERRLNLAQRWEHCSGSPVPPVSVRHPLLPMAHASMLIPHWASLFEQEDAATARFTLEVRRPFLDLRIVNFLLALPPFPWVFDKQILREAMVGKIPESVRTRPKTPMQSDPLAVHLTGQPGNPAQWAPEMDHYVNRAVLPGASAQISTDQSDAATRPLCLNFWLQSYRRVRYNLKAEAWNG